MTLTLYSLSRVPSLTGILAAGSMSLQVLGDGLMQAVLSQHSHAE
jgi:hypothetical protein